MYYEYPNVFLYVLVCHYLGVRRGFECDLTVNPLVAQGAVTLENYGIRYRIDNGALELANISGRSLIVDLPRLGKELLWRRGKVKRFNNLRIPSFHVLTTTHRDVTI